MCIGLRHQDVDTRLGRATCAKPDPTHSHICHDLEIPTGGTDQQVGSGLSEGRPSLEETSPWARGGQPLKSARQRPSIDGSAASHLVEQASF